MSYIPTVEQARELVMKYNKEPFHIQHAETVSKVMGELAKEFDSENDAIEYAIHTNTARDSLSEQEIEDQYTVLQYKRLAESTSRLGRKLRITTMEVSL